LNLKLRILKDTIQSAVILTISLPTSFCDGHGIISCALWAKLALEIRRQPFKRPLDYPRNFLPVFTYNNGWRVLQVKTRGKAIWISLVSINSEKRQTLQIDFALVEQF
jgi:hypothetical protein